MKAADDLAVMGRLSSSQLPVIPSGVFDLLAVLGDDMVDFSQIVVNIERFPTITARLISLANSPWSSPVTEVSSLEVACSRLGLNVVKSTSVALLVSAPFDSTRCPAFDAQSYWTRALSVADTVCQLASHITGNIAEQALHGIRTAGLLHNLGLLWMADQVPELTQRALQAELVDGRLELDQGLAALAGVGYRQAGGYLARAWGLPSSLVLAAQYHDQSDYDGEAWPVVRLTGLAVSMMSAAEVGMPWVASPAALQGLGIEPAEADRVNANVGSQLEQTRALAASLFCS